MPLAADRFLPRGSFGALLDLLRRRGYTVIGPTVHDGAIVYKPLESSDQLPGGWRAEQAPGRYAMRQVDSPRQFAWANGPQAMKPLFFAPRESLWQATRDAHGKLAFKAVVPAAQPLAVIGARACDLAALALSDAHFMGEALRQPGFSPFRLFLLVFR